MTTTTWTSPLAGVLGRGIGDMRPYPGVVVSRTVEATPVTGLPIAGFAPEVGGIGRLRPPTSVAAFDHTPAPAAQTSSAQQSTQNDDTLGIHPPGRPQS